jgi:hypothetical protein
MSSCVTRIEHSFRQANAGAQPRWSSDSCEAPVCKRLLADSGFRWCETIYAAGELRSALNITCTQGVPDIIEFVRIVE